MTPYLDRQLHLLGFALSSLLRRKGKNSALFLVYTLVVFLLGSVMFFTYALKREAELLLKEVPEIIVQRTVMGRYETIPENYRDKISGIRGVISVRGRLWGYYYDPTFRANFTMVVPETFTYQPGEIGIGAGVSSLRQIYAGDTFSFKGADGKPRNYIVKEVLPETSQLVSADLVVISAEDYRDLTGLAPGLMTDLALKVRNLRELPTIAEKIVALLPDTRPIIRTEMQRTYDAVFTWRGGLLLVILSISTLSFGIFAWDKASGLSAEERKEIGILKAIGWETSDVLAMKCWEGLSISLLAFLAGTLLAYLHVFVASASLFMPVLKGWSTLYPSFRLTPFINLGQLVSLFMLTVVPYTVATIIPAWRAATIDPDAVIRN